MAVQTKEDIVVFRTFDLHFNLEDITILQNKLYHDIDVCYELFDTVLLC